MSREIKFRAWREKDKHMLSWNEISGCCNGLDWLNTATIPIMQFTGLLDKNGKEIYEGDIISNGEIVWEIGFRNGRFGALHNEHKEFLTDFNHTYISTYCEIKGNKFETKLDDATFYKRLFKYANKSDKVKEND